MIMTFVQPIRPEIHSDLTAGNIQLSRTTKPKQLLQFSQGCHSKLTQIVDPVGMRSFGIVFLHKSEVMRGFCHHVPMILPCFCEQFPKLAPGVSLHIERFQFRLLLSLDWLLTARGFKDFKARLFSFHGCCHVACFWKDRIAEVQHHPPAAQRTFRLPKHTTAKPLAHGGIKQWNEKDKEGDFCSGKQVAITRLFRMQ